MARIPITWIGVPQSAYRLRSAPQTGSDMTFSFALDYFICVFICCNAVLQLAAHSADLSMLKIIRNKSLNYLISTGLIFFSAVLFFNTDNRIINDFEGGLDANQQAVIFFLSALSSFLTTGLTASVINSSKHKKSTQNVGGLASYRNYRLIELLNGKWINLR